jgi:hypothetical protein
MLSWSGLSPELNRVIDFPELIEQLSLMAVGIIVNALLLCVLKPTMIQEFRRDLWPMVSKKFGILNKT